MKRERMMKMFALTPDMEIAKNRAYEDNGYKVLIIDENIEFVKFIRRILSYLGFKVHVAFNGRDGIQMGLQVKPDLIFSSTELQDEFGCKIAERVKQETEATVIAVLEDADQIDLAGACFDAHLLKPVSTSLMMELIQNAIKKTEYQRRVG